MAKTNSKKKSEKLKSGIVINWIESNLFIPEGKHVGKPFILAPFQKETIRLIYDNPAGTRRAIISFPRKNAKSTLVACLMLVHLCGPLAVRNGQLFSAARTRDQAALLFGLAAKMVAFSPTLRPFCKITETKKQISCPDLGTVYKALSSDAANQLGLSPVWVCHDELGAVKGPTDALYDALETASAAQENPLTIVLSTQAPSNGDLLSLLIDDAQTAADNRTVCKVYSCPEDVDWRSPEALKIANPAWDSFINRKELEGMQQDAIRIPSKEASFRNFILNQRIETTESFIPVEIWQEGKDKPEDWEGKELYMSLDLSRTSDLTCLMAMYKQDNGKWGVKPWFFLPDDGLHDKAIADRTPWVIWRDQGYLNTTQGRVVGYDFVAKLLMDISEKATIKKVAFDSYNINHFKPKLLDAGFTEKWIETHFEGFRQGFISMGPAVTKLENLILEGNIQHGSHPILNMCLSNVKVLSDPAKNRKFDKISASRKIDGMVCLAMCCGIMDLSQKEVVVSYLETYHLKDY